MAKERLGRIDHMVYDIDVKLCAFTVAEMKEAEQEYGAFKLEN